jgi:hypothetical protein
MGRVRLTLKADYAIRALAELAARSDGRPVKAEELADIGARLASLVRSYQPATIGVCIRTGGALRPRLADTKAIFTAMAKELSS